MATKKKPGSARAVAKTRPAAKARTAAKSRTARARSSAATKKSAPRARAATPSRAAATAHARPAPAARATIGKRMTHRDVVAQLTRRRAEHVRPLTMEAPIRQVRPAVGHKFRAGQTVTLLPNRYGADRNGSFEVTRLLPEEHGVNHYRLKSVADGHERVAGEDELI